MYIKSEYRKLLSSVVIAILLVSFFFTPLSSIIPLASGASDSWWNSTWPYRKAITINHTKVGGFLENFPVLIDINDGNLASSAQYDGDDIVFVDSSTNMTLDHEIEYFDHDSGHLVAWVRLPLLDHTTDRKFYMYYGNADAENQENSTAVWDFNYKMIQHLSETLVPEILDSTLNENNGTVYGGIAQGVTGQMDGACEFDGVSGFIEVPHSETICGFSTGFTVSVWVKFGEINRRQTILQKYDTVNFGRAWLLDYRPDFGRALGFLVSTVGNGYSWWYTHFNPGVEDWYHLTVVWEPNVIPKFYINGEQVPTVFTGTTSGIYNNIGTPLHIGKSTYSPGRELKGSIDEISLSDSARSEEWILTCYNNQKNPSAFYTVGFEETYSGAPSISDEKPLQGALEVNTNPTLSIHATDLNGDLMTIIFGANATGTWETIQHYMNVEDGTYTCSPTNMNELGTKYYWRVSVTDGESWTNGTFSFTTTATVLKHKWTTAGLPQGTSGALVADINGDNIEDVVCAGRGGVAALNGVDGAVIWTISDSGLGWWCKPQMSDLNLDGIPEIVLPYEYTGGIHVIHANNGSTYWRRTDLGAGCMSSPVIADIDGSGYPTIFIATQDITNGLDGLGRVMSLSYDGRILHQTFSWRPCAGGLSIADTDGDGEFELYMGDRDINYGDGGYGRGIRSFWAKNLTVRWERPEFVASSHIPMLADVNNDGILDVIVGEQRNWPGLAVLNSRDGTSIRQSLSNGVPFHYQPSVYDIDGDGNLEILMADGNHPSYNGPDYHDVVVFDLVEWEVDGRLYVGDCVYGPQVADVTGDGVMEIIAASFHGIHIIKFNITDGTYSVIAEVILPEWEILNYAVVQDIDGDGYNELVVSSQTGRVYAYDTPARRPAQRARSEVQFYSERRLGVAEYVSPPGIPAPAILDPSPLNGAANVPISISQLGFKLTDFQGDPMNYTVTTTPYIGSGSGTNVANGKYTISITSLEYDATYTWNVTATDGTNTNTKIFTFTTQPQPPWWNTDWQYRRVIVIDPSKVGSDQTDFPVVIDLTDSGLTGKAQQDGDDFVFTDESNLKLNHEIESYDYTTGHLIVWVNAPYVSSTTETILYMYYGNPGASNQENPMAVWDTSHKLVLHLSETHECRMWGMIAESLPHDVVLDHLIYDPSSLKVLGGSNRDGWGLVWYNSSDPEIRRGPVQANLDPNFDLAANEMADSGAWVGIGHVRARSQGAIPPEGNPHPFMRYKGGKWWAFEHNGNLNKDILKSLIGPEYLAANPPTVGENWDDPDVVDSDLYGLYVLKCIEANGWNAILGIAQAVTDITEAGADSGANFLLTNGEKLWGFRKDNTLYYYQATPPQYSTVASQPPDPVEPGWVSLSDYNLITLTKNNPPSIITDIRQQYPLLIDSEFNDSVDSDDLRANAAEQDWYESREDVPALLFLDESDVAGNIGKKAGFTASSSGNAYLSQEFSSTQTSTFSVQWDIYVDSILDVSPRRAGQMMIGADGGSGPNRADAVRFVFLAFNKTGGGESGTADLVAMLDFNTQVLVASDLNLDQWYTIKVDVDVAAGTYDVYVDGVFMATVDACTALSSVTHISFAQWNDGAGTFYVDNVFSPTANRYKLTITTEGNGSVAVDPAESSYLNGTEVTLTAVPESSWSFSTWKGDASGGANPITITMDGYKTVIANFTQTLLVDSEFNDSVDSADLRADNATAQDWYESRADDPTILFLDESDVDGNAGKKAGFTANNLDNAYVSQEFSSAQTGTFSVQWDIYVDSILDISSPDRAGFMLIGSDLDASGGPNRNDPERFVYLAFYKDGGATSGTADLVAMSSFSSFAAVATDLNLDQWHTIRVVVNVTDGTYDVYVDDVFAANVAACTPLASVTHISFAQWNDGAGAFCVDNVFAPAVDRYKLIINVIGNGSVTVDPGESTYAVGTEVNLTATADSGWVFSNWSGDLTGSANPTTITMNSNKNVTATFTKPQYTLTINIVGSGSVTKNPDKSTYDPGESVNLTASPSIGWSFFGWSGDLSGSNNPDTIIMDGNKVVAARFIQEGTCIDSTLNGNDGLLYGGITQGVTGEIDGAYEFDGIDDYIEVAHSDTITGFTEAFTASFWLKLEDTTRRQAILNKYDTANNERGWFIEFQDNAYYGKVLGFFASQDGPTYRYWFASFNPTAGAWYYITVVWEANTIPKFYVDGVQVPTMRSDTIAFINNNPAAPLHIGRCTYAAGRYLQGNLDEIRISNPAKSADYILTCYNNQKDPTIFYQIGLEETLPTEPIISDQYPTDGATNIPITLNELNFTLTDYQGDLMDYYVSTYPDIGSDSATGVDDGRCSVPISGVEYQTTYTWYVNVTDGVEWTNATYTFTTESPVMELLVDSDFNNSTDSADLRANSPEQDWYESRADDPTILFLDESDVGGNTGKKVGFTANAIDNAYCTQEFSSAQTDTFTAQWDIYVDSILDVSPRRAGQMLIGTSNAQYSPSQNDVVRFVFLAFYKPGGGESGTADLVAMLDFDTQVTVASGLNLDQWFTIKVIVDVAAGTYEIYVDDAYKTTVGAVTALSSVTHISFAQWNDGAGAFYVDNVSAFKEAEYTLQMNVVGGGSVQKDPDQATYAYGTEVNLTAISDPGWTFDGWSGDLSGTDNPDTIIMDGDKNITATFTLLNTAPIIDSWYPLADPSILEGESQVFNVTYHDNEGDILTVQWLLNGSNVGSGDEYSFVADYNDSGIYNVTVAVSDAEYSTTHEWTLTVSDVGPTLWMPFDSDETPDAVDESGYENNGTVYGAEWTSDYSGCYLFNASESDYIEVPDDASLDGAGTWSELTVEFWIKPTIDNKGVRLIEKRSAGSSYQIGFQTTPSPGIDGNQLYWNVWTSTSYKEIIAPFGLLTDEWSHVVCTYKDGVGMTIYVNGTVAISTLHTGTINESTCPINIGRRGDDTSYFTGFMDDLRLYIKALPEPLIQQHFDETKETYVEVNHPPEIDSYYPTIDPSILEGESQLFNVTYHDPDGDPLTVQWLLNGSSVGSGDEYTFIAGYDDSGVYNVTAAVSDSEYSTTHQWTLTVDDVGPTLLMPFNSDESPAAVDESGYGNNGTVYGPEWTSDYGGCYLFNASETDYIVVPDDVSLDGGGTWTEITIEFWIKPTIDNKGVRLIEKRSAGSSYQIGFQTTPSSGVSGNQLYWNVWASSYKEIVAPFGLETDKWSHVVCWYKDGEGMTIYVNSTLAISASHSGTINDSTCPINIGRRGDGTSYFTGLMDDIRLYIKALPEPLIQQHYDETKDSYVEVNHPPVVSNPEPAHEASGVSVSTSLLNFTISDADGESMDYYVSTSPDIGSDNALGVSDGTYSLSVSGLTDGTEYTWLVNVTDGTDWTNSSFTFTTEELLLVDSEFNDSVDSDDLRANNATAQDWYESRADDPTILFLDENDVAGNNGKKAGFTANEIDNAYLSQEFSSAQTGTFTVQWDIYVDSILTGSSSNYRAGIMMIGRDGGSGPNRLTGDRFVYMVFSKPGGGETGTMDLVAPGKITVATDLNLDQWYTIKVVVNVTAGTYDVYVDGEFKATVNANAALATLTHISFAQWDDGAGAFYVDNVFSPPQDRYKLTVNLDGSGTVTIDPGESSYASGTEVTLNATADVGWTFSSWSGDISTIENPTNVTMNADKNVTAVFTAEANAPPEVSNPEPADLATGVPVSTSLLNFTLTDANADSMDYYILTSPDIGSDSALGVPDGNYNLSISGLAYDTTYTWWVNVTDGTDWTNTTYTLTTESLLLLDSEFNDSVDSADLRADNATAQDWYESRAQVPTLLFLDESDIGGNTGKKAGFTASASGNAYLTQEFSSAQAGTFSVQWDIYVDSILAVSPYRAGQMMIGSTSASYGPNRNDAVRFVFLAFYKNGGATSGTADLVAMLDFNTQVTVVSDLNLDQWYTVKVDVDVAADTYDVYVDSVYEGTLDACTALSSLTHISFAQWNDGAGAFYVDNVSAPATSNIELTSMDPNLTSPSGAYRWMDVANQTYSSDYMNNYNYTQATVTVIYNEAGNTLTGTLAASNLKPNFAYQLKLVGTPGTDDNERIGLAGRWWQEIWNGTAWTDGWNLNSKGDGTSPNPNDITYFERRFIPDSSSPTGYHYRYTGYLVLDYFITDSDGNARINFETGNCYHVLWQTTQRGHTTNDGPLKIVTFDPDPSEFAYDVDYSNSTITIFGEWERLPMGEVHLPAGLYNCQIVLTEESFHGDGPLEGNWAGAMSANISFTVID